MVFLGIVLAATAVGVAVGIVTENSTSASLSLFGHHVPAVNTEARVFIAGLIVGMLVIAGLSMASRSMRRSSQARREFRDLREERQESISTLLTQNQQLQRELARSRAAGSAPMTGEMPATPRQGRDREPASPFFDHSA